MANSVSISGRRVVDRMLDPEHKRGHNAQQGTQYAKIPLEARET